MDVQPSHHAYPACQGKACVGEGGPQRGNRQLAAYSNYADNAAHDNGHWVETLVFQQRTIAAADVGTAWTCQFDAKRFNLEAPSTAPAGQIPQFGLAHTATDCKGPAICHDNISFALAPVPEPATRALMLAGPGVLGAAVRRRSR